MKNQAIQIQQNRTMLSAKLCKTNKLLKNIFMNLSIIS